MSPELTYTLLGAIIPAIGWVGREFWKSLKEAREGKKAEADRIADERDKWKQKAAENERLAENYYNRKKKVYDALYATRRIAMEDGNVASEDLPPVPPNHH